jgi:hypothetical protein
MSNECEKIREMTCGEQAGELEIGEMVLGKEMAQSGIRKMA